MEFRKILSQMFLRHGSLYCYVQTVVGKNHVQYLDSAHLELSFKLMQLSLFFHATAPLVSST